MRQVAWQRLERHAGAKLTPNLTDQRSVARENEGGLRLGYDLPGLDLGRLLRGDVGGILPQRNRGQRHDRDLRRGKQCKEPISKRSHTTRSTLRAKQRYN